MKDSMIRPLRLWNEIAAGMQIRGGMDGSRETAEPCGITFGVDEDFGAEAAGKGRGVYGGALDARAEVRRLCNGVLLGVDAAAELVPRPGWDVELDPDAAGLGAVGKPARGAVVTGRENVLVLHVDGAHVAPQTGGPGGGQLRHVHEVLVRGGALHVRLMRVSVLYPILVEE